MSVLIQKFMLSVLDLENLAFCSQELVDSIFFIGINLFFTILIQ